MDNTPLPAAEESSPTTTSSHGSSQSQAQREVVSPSNQPRPSLPADYQSWVHDVSTQRPPSTSAHNPSATSSHSSRPSSSFLDAVRGRSASHGRARRENQPSFTGSALTISDTEEPASAYEGPGPGDARLSQDEDPENDPSPQFDHPQQSVRAPRLPPLSKSRVESQDPNRPAFKLGPPIVPKAHPSKAANPQYTSELGSGQESSETSALLGSRIRSPPDHPGSQADRWTNEGSRQRTPRYNSTNQTPDGESDEGAGNDSEDDAAQRRSRARSLSPNMESRRGNTRNRGRIIFSNYGNEDGNGHGHRHGNGHRSQSAFRKLRRSSIANINLVKEKLLSRRSGHYDDAKEALVKENNGIRVWYHNYTTIDWIHDFVKERVRLRHLRSIGGIRGMIKNRADSLKGWVLVLLTGVITACLAAFIDVSSWWLGDLRMGYCTTNFWWSQYFCCWESNNDAQFQPAQLHTAQAQSCSEWVSWSQALSADDVILGISRDTFDWIVYISFGTLFAGICVIMVTSDGTVSQQRSHGATKRRGAAKNKGIPASDSRATMESVLDASQPKKIAYFGAGSGIPEVKTILGGFVIRGFLGFRTLLIKLIGLPLMVASGLNMGKQGPLVHIACCVGNIVCRIFDKYNRNDGKRREILSAAAASGVAVAFGAPIGGVLFSLEEVSYYFPSKTMWRTYFCALISAVVLKMINPYRVGKTVLFQVTYDRDWHLFEAIPFFFISVFGGAYGAIFSQFHMSYSRFRSRTWIGRHPVQEVLMVTVLTCAIQWRNPWTRVNLLQLLTNLYSECTPENSLQGMCAVDADQIYPIFLLLAQVFAVKVFLNFVTFGVKVPGGIFIPTMVAGAVFGRMVGLGVQWLIATYPEQQIFQVCKGNRMDCIIPGLYAMIGAAACLAGVTRMTVSLVVIMFELTGAMTYSLPIMMAVMMGKFVGDAFSPDAFFNKLINLNEHPYLDNKKDYNTFGTAADIADRYLETINVNELNDVDSLRRKVEILAGLGYSDGGLPIVDRGILVGYIASNELGHALELAEKKDPNCICVFRNRASSNVPAVDILESLHGLESTGVLGSGGHLSMSPTSQDTPIRPSQEWLRQARENEFDYDNDMQGPNRQSPLHSGRKSDLDPLLRSDSRSFGSTGSDLAGIAYNSTEHDRQGSFPQGSRRSAYSSGRVSSTGTTDLLRDPAHTMDFTPFTDQAPLSVSLFSSMDLVMELFIKLGIKYVCVVKAGEHYGMIHKKRLLSFLKENDEKQKHQARSNCF